LGDINTKTTGYKAGFAGINETGATISKSFCDENITASNTAKTDYFVGNAVVGSTLFKCYYNEAMVFTNSAGTAFTPTTAGGTATDVATLQSESFLFDTLAWSRDDWTTVYLAYPKLAWQVTE